MADADESALERDLRSRDLGDVIRGHGHPPSNAVRVAHWIHIGPATQSARVTDSIERQQTDVNASGREALHAEHRQIEFLLRRKMFSQAGVEPRFGQHPRKDSKLTRGLPASAY